MRAQHVHHAKTQAQIQRQCRIGDAHMQPHATFRSLRLGKHITYQAGTDSQPPVSGQQGKIEKTNFLFAVISIEAADGLIPQQDQIERRTRTLREVAGLLSRLLLSDKFDPCLVSPTAKRTFGFPGTGMDTQKEIPVLIPNGTQADLWIKARSRAEHGAQQRWRL
nr:hypothetical protein [Candidatus Dactylopiibacterium carminicum]